MRINGEDSGRVPDSIAGVQAESVYHPQLMRALWGLSRTDLINCV